MATSDKVKLRYITEVTKGTTPTTPAFKELRLTGETINNTIATIVSKELRPDRTQADLMNAQADVAGDLNVELSYGSYDDFFAAALGGTWATDVLKDGAANPVFFTIQKDIVDATPETYFNFRGCTVGGFNLNIQTGQIVTGAFNFRGMTAQATETQIAGATFVPTNANTPFNATQNVGSVTFDGVAYTGCINTLSMAFNNNLRTQDCVGTFGHTDIKFGKKELTGSMNMYFIDKSNYDAFVNSTDFALSFTLTDVGGNLYTVLLPRVKFESATVVAEGENSDIMFNATYRALYDSTETCMIKITRNPI